MRCARWLLTTSLAGILLIGLAPTALAACPDLDHMPPCAAGQPAGSGCIYQGEISLTTEIGEACLYPGSFDPKHMLATNFLPNSQWLRGTSGNDDSSGILTLSGWMMGAGIVASILAIIIGAFTWAAAHYELIGNGKIRFSQSAVVSGALAAVLIPNLPGLMHFGLQLLQRI